MAFSLEFAYGKLKRWNQWIIRALTHPPLSLFTVHFPVFFHYPAVQPETASLRIEWRSCECRRERFVNVWEGVSKCWRAECGQIIRWKLLKLSLCLNDVDEKRPHILSQETITVTLRSCVAVLQRCHKGGSFSQRFQALRPRASSTLEAIN